MNTKVLITIALLFGLFFTQCKKPDNFGKDTTIEGTLVSKLGSKPVPGVRVMLMKIHVEDDMTENLDFYTTDANGKYQFEVTENRQETQAYVIAVEVPFNFYEAEGESVIERAEIDTADVVVRNVTLIEAGTLELKIKNSEPFNEDDKINISEIEPAYILDATSVSVHDDFTYTGTTVEEMITAKVKGAAYTRIHYSTIKNNQQNSYVDSVYVGVDDTFEYMLEY